MNAPHIQEREVFVMDDDSKRQVNNTQGGPDQGEQMETQDMVATNLNGQQPGIGTPPAQGTETHSKRDEEFAAEMTADDISGTVRDEEDTETGTQANSAFGWIALSLSIISFFIMPIILGGAGIIVGFISRSRGADTLGNTAIIAGAASILITLFVLPYV